MKKSYVLGGIVLIAILAVGYITYRTYTATQKPIQVVALFPLTGGLASYGEPAQKAAQLAVEDINAQGGINGKKLEVLYQDHQCDPKVALSIYKQFSQTTKLFTSAACSGTVLSIAPNLVQDKVLLLGTIVTTPKITGVSPYVFRNWSSDEKEAFLLAEHIKQQGYKHIGMLYEETDYAKGLALSLEQFLKDSGIQFTKESFASKATDVRTQLTKLKNANPDVVFISPQTTTNAEVALIQMEQMNYHPKLLINDNVLKAGELVKKYASLLEGSIGGDYVIRQSEKSKEILNRYQKKYNAACQQENICLGVYDAIHLLALGIQTNDATAEGVQKYLQTVSYDGVSGTIAFDEKNDRKNSDYSLFRIVRGMRELIQ